MVKSGADKCHKVPLYGAYIDRNCSYTSYLPVHTDKIAIDADLLFQTADSWPCKMHTSYHIAQNSDGKNLGNSVISRFWQG